MKQSDLFQKCGQILQNRCTPEIINELKDNEVFVFGSKPDGHHESGAAKIAVEKFGAIEGLSEGLARQSYAIPVHHHRTEVMAEAVARFIACAKAESSKVFYVLPIGCGNANMNVNVVAKMFVKAIELDNVFLSAMFIKAIRSSIVIPEDEVLPIKYVDEAINADCLRGRMMGLMAEISKRTDKHITFDDEILKEDNMLLHAFLRVAKVVTKEEQRVMNVLMDEAKKMSESRIGKELENGTLRTLEFVKGWKLEANKIFEDGGSMYDLLSFSNPYYIKTNDDIKKAKGYRGELEDGILEKFEIDGKFGLKDKQGNIVVSAVYENIKSSRWRGRGWNLKQGNKWGAVNERGEWLFAIEYDEIETRYEGGHFLTKNGRKGFCNSEGVYTIDFLYDDLENCNHEWDGFKAKLDGKWGYVDGNGKVVVPIEYDSINLDSSGMIRVERNHRYGFYNTKTGAFFPEKYYLAFGYISSHPEECIVNVGERWGVVNTQDEIVLPIEYEDMNIDSENVYRVQQNGLYGIIDKEGNIIFPFKYQDLGSFDKNGVTYAKNDAGLYGYIDKYDNVVIPFAYRNARNFKGRYAEVGMGWGEKGVIDNTGKIVVPMVYKSVYIRLDDVIEVEKDDGRNRRHLRGLYDLKTGNILPCIYESISPRGRDRDGLLECECCSDRNSEPKMIKVDSRTVIQTATNGRIAIARDFAVILMKNGCELEIIGHNPEFRQLGRHLIKVAAGFDGYMALDENGRIHAGPKAREFERGYEIESLHNVVDVVGCEGHTVTLHTDGTVTCVDEPESWDGPDRFADEVKSWNSIVQVACGFGFVAGLKSDGTLVSAGRYYRCPDWHNIKQFDAFNCYYGNIYTIALLNDGRVVTDFSDEVSAWRNVVRVRVGDNGFAVGLKSDGTAYALGDNKFVRDVQSWHNIVEIECKFKKAVAILADGSDFHTGF